jgi:hypothetical protein
LPTYYTGQTATWEEASKCFHCQREMREIGQPKTPPRNLSAKVHTLQCMYDDCPYYMRTKAHIVHDTGDPNAEGDRWNRLVEKLADGTIPIRPQGLRGKELPRLPRMSDEAVSMMADRIQEEDDLIAKLTRQGGSGARLDPNTGRVVAPPED